MDIEKFKTELGKKRTELFTKSIMQWNKIHRDHVLGIVQFDGEGWYSMKYDCDKDLFKTVLEAIAYSDIDKRTGMPLWVYGDIDPHADRRIASIMEKIKPGQTYLFRARGAHGMGFEINMLCEEDCLEHINELILGYETIFKKRFEYKSPLYGLQ